MRTGVFTSLENMGVVNKQHIAGGTADHLQAVASCAGKGQRPAKDAAGTQLLHHSGDPILINPNQRRLSPLHNSDGIIFRASEVIHQLIRAKRPLHGLKAGQHSAVLLIADVFKQRASFQILLCQHDTPP